MMRPKTRLKTKMRSPNPPSPTPPQETMRLRPTLHQLLWPLVVLSLLFTASIASAQERAHVRVDVIIASDSDEHIDAQLRAHAKTLQEQFPQFSRFDLHHTADLALEEGTTQRVPLTNDTHASVTLEAVRAHQYTLQLKVPGGQTTIKARAGAMFFLGGPKAPSGTLLLLIQIQ